MTGRRAGGTRRRCPALRALAGVAVVALLAAGCSPGSTAPADGVTPGQIVLGSTQPLSGVAAPGYDEIAPASEAVFRWVDAHGGIDGRRIVYDYVDDGYLPETTAEETAQLLDRPIFADFDPVGSATQIAVRPLLNQMRIPQLFVGGGCSCWSEARYPWTWGWSTGSMIEGKILGRYVATHYRGERVAVIYQDDAFGWDGVKGLDLEIPKPDLVARRPYTVDDLSAPLGIGAQVRAARSAGAKVVVLFSIPTATAEALVAAAASGYEPHWVVSAAGSDADTLDRLLSGFTGATGTGGLVDGIVSDSFLPSPADPTDPWIELFRRIYRAYEDTSANGFDANTVYGMAVAVTAVELLQAVGPDLTRAKLIATLASKGSALDTPGLLPLRYSASDHDGFEGTRMGVIGPSGLVEAGPVYVTTASPSAPITTYSGPTARPPSFSDPRF